MVGKIYRNVDDFGVIRPMCLLLDCKGAFEERFGFSSAVLCLVQSGQVEEPGRVQGMLFTVSRSSELNEVLRNGSCLWNFSGLVEGQAALVHLLELRRPFLSYGG